MIRTCHVTDLHYKSDTKLLGFYNSLRDKLIAVLSSKDTKPDIIIFSGDILDRGNYNEFPAFKKWLDSILDAVDFSYKQCVFAYGNHDLVRNELDNEFLLYKKSYKKFNEELVSKFDYFRKQFEILENSFSSISYLDKFTTLPDTTLIGFRKVKNYRLIVLNSSWLCFLNENSNSFERIRIESNLVANDELGLIEQLILFQSEVLEILGLNDDIVVNIKSLTDEVKSLSYVDQYNIVCNKIIKYLAELWEFSRLSTGSQLLKAIKKEIAKSDENLQNIIIQHHPPIFLNDIEIHDVKTNNPENGEFIKFCKDLDIKHIFCGHIHQAEITSESFYYDISCLVGGYFGGVEKIEVDKNRSPNFFNIYSIEKDELIENYHFQFNGNDFSLLK